MYIKADNDGNILNISGEVIPDGVEVLEEQILVQFDSKDDVWYSFEDGCIRRKSSVRLVDEYREKIIAEINRKIIESIYKAFLNPANLESKLQTLKTNILNATTKAEIKQLVDEFEV